MTVAWPDFRGPATVPGAARPPSKEETERARDETGQRPALPLTEAEAKALIDRYTAIKEKVRISPWLPHDPTPKQTMFLMLDQREVLFGGQAGGGKSDALLMGAAMHVMDHPAYAALLLRRNFSDLALPGALMDRAFQWWGGTAAKWHPQTKSWSFPGGGTITFGYLQNSMDRYRYASAEFQFIGWDELTQFTELDYRFLFSRLRRTRDMASIPIQMRSASNPGGRGHDWVRARFIANTGTDRRAFLPAGLDDNPYLDREEYIESLGELDPTTLAQLLSGDWDAVPAGDMFRRETFPTIPLAALPMIRHWIRFWDCAATEESATSKDPDWTAGVLLGQDYEDRLYIVDVVRGRWGPKGVENIVMKTAREDGHQTTIRMEQEPGSSGKTVIASFARKLRGFDFDGKPATGKKTVRARPVAAMAGRGDISLVDNGQRFGTWVETFLSELEAFSTPGVHDDQVDALSGAFNNLSFRADVGTDLAARNRKLGESRKIPMPSGRSLGSTPI